MGRIWSIADLLRIKASVGSYPLPDIVFETTALPTFEIAKSATDVPKVQVTPRRQTLVTVSRSQDQWDFFIDVGMNWKGVQSKIGLDALVKDGTTLIDLLLFQTNEHLTLGGGETALLIGIENEPTVFPDHLEEHAVFTSVLTYNFRQLIN